MPMLAGNVLQTAYSLINAFWVGKFLGSSALAAITVSFPAVFVLMAVAGGLTLATNILISQYVGARNWRQVRRVAQSSTILIGAMGLLLLAFGVLTAETLLRAMNTPPEVLPLATGYLRIFLYCLPCIFGFFLFSAMLRGAGDSKTPLYFQAVSVAMNGVLDPILMFGLLGLPRLGLNGTAVATVISQTVALIALLIHLHRKHHIIAPDWRHLQVDWQTWWLTIKIGFPSVIQMSLVSVGMLFVVGFVNAFGENAAAAFGAASRIDQVAFLPAMTIGAAVSTLAGQNIGARRYHRVNQVFTWGILLSGGITLIGSVLTVTLAGWLLRLFINDPKVISIGVHYLHIVGSCYVFFAIMFVSNGVINGSGHTFTTTVITLVSLWVVRVPLAAALPRYFHGVVGIWYALVISSGTSMLISLAYYLSGRWKRQVIKQVAAPAPVDEMLAGSGETLTDVVP
jgi:putative MATE family efflux protein